MKKGEKLNMPTNESVLKKLLTSALQEASILILKARNETVTADEVATAYATAINNINEYCKSRNRY